jgi:hypothetical protein
VASLHLLPDVEALVIQYLLTVDEVTEITDTHIGSRLPKTPTFPRLVVTRVGGTAGTIPAHLDEARVQIDAWADLAEENGGKRQAHDLARTAQAAMYDMVNAVHEDAVVTDVEGVLGPLWAPDDKTRRPRYIVDMIVRLHPLPSS